MGSWEYEQLDLESDGVPQPPALLEQKEELRGLIAGMRRLPDAQRQALTLRELEGCSYEEISARLGHTGSGVRQLIFRARTTLAQGRLGDAAPVRPPAGPARRMARRWKPTRSRASPPSRRRRAVGSETLGAAALAVVAVLGGVAGGERSMRATEAPAAHTARSVAPREPHAPDGARRPCAPRCRLAAPSRSQDAARLRRRPARRRHVRRCSSRPSRPPRRPRTVAAPVAARARERPRRPGSVPPIPPVAGRRSDRCAAAVAPVRAARPAPRPPSPAPRRVSAAARPTAPPAPAPPARPQPVVPEAAGPRSARPRSRAPLPVSLRRRAEAPAAAPGRAQKSPVAPARPKKNGPAAARAARTL